MPKLPGLNGFLLFVALLTAMVVLPIYNHSQRLEKIQGEPGVSSIMATAKTDDYIIIRSEVYGISQNQSGLHLHGPARAPRNVIFPRIPGPEVLLVQLGTSEHGLISYWIHGGDPQRINEARLRIGELQQLTFRH